MTSNNIFQKLADNLNILMAKERINASELARQTSLPPTTIKRFRNNDNANPTLTSLLPIAKYFSLTVSQLIGEDPIITYDGVALGSKKEAVTYIPLLNWEEAADLEMVNYQLMPHKIPVEHKVSKKAFALKIHESDFENLAKDSVIIIDPSVTPKTGDLVIVAKGNESVVVKKFISDDGKTYLKPLMRGLNATELTSQHRIIGVVIQTKTDFR
jgi:SOS-response transcriptional repressor LexA